MARCQSTRKLAMNNLNPKLVFIRISMAKRSQMFIKN